MPVAISHDGKIHSSETLAHSSPTSAEKELLKQEYRSRFQTEKKGDMLVIDSQGVVVAGDPSPQASVSSPKHKHQEHVRRRGQKKLAGDHTILSLCEEGVVRGAEESERVCAAADGTIHEAKINPAPLRSPTAAKKKALLLAKGQLAPPSPVLVCDHAGPICEAEVKPDVVVAGQDGTIHAARVTPRSPVHAAVDKKRQKALYRASPKAGPIFGSSSVYTVSPTGQVDVPEVWDFFLPPAEVGVAF
jgi:hypothetical protein